VFFLLPVLFLLWSCSTEEILKLPERGEVPISFSFPISRGLGNPENEGLNSVRMVIFRSSGAATEVGDPFLNEVYYPSAPNASEIEIVNLMVPVGYLNIYLIGNEPNWMNLGSVTRSSQLAAQALNYSDSETLGFVKSPFVMYSAYKTVYVSPSGEISHPDVAGITGPPVKYVFPIERTVAKFTVHIDCDFSNLGGTSRAIDIDSMMIISMPLSPWLVPGKTYTETDYFSTDWLNLNTPTPYFRDKWDASNTIKTGIETIPSGITFYVPEHSLNNTPLSRSRFTCLRLVGHLRNVLPPTKVVYRVPLGNGLFTPYTAMTLLEDYATVPVSALAITRNMHYTLRMNIIGLGGLHEVSVEVADWDHENLDGTPYSPYLNVSTTSTTVNGMVSQRIYFWTNQADAYLELQGMESDSFSGTPFAVNNVFQTVAGPQASGVWPANFHFDPGTGNGYFDVIVNTNTSLPSTRYLVYLRSNHLRREIEVITSNNAPPLWSTNKWVGTFHRASEKGNESSMQATAAIGRQR